MVHSLGWFTRFVEYVKRNNLVYVTSLCTITSFLSLCIEHIRKMTTRTTLTVAWPGENARDPDEAALVSAILTETPDNIFCQDEAKTEVRYVEVTEDDNSPPRIEIANDGDRIRTWIENKDQPVAQSKCRARFFSFYPVGQQGRGKLAVTRSSMFGILDFLNAFPQFYRFIATYQHKLYPTDESFGRLDYDVSCSREKTIQEIELCYILKYVERRAERDSKQWSFRQCLMYQKASLAAGDPHSTQTDHILVRPSQKMRDRLSERMHAPQTGGTGLVFDWTAVHSACWSGIDWGFREMTVELDELVTEIADNITLFSISVSETTNLENPASVAKDMKALQSVTDKLCRLRPAIKVNLHTLESLSKMCKSLLRQENDKNRNDHRPLEAEGVERIRRFVEKLGKWKREHRFADAHAATILERANHLSSQLRDTVAMRINETNRVSSDAIFELSQRSSHEANIVKFLTVLALIFIPANFCADFLQMGYIKLSPNAAFHIEAESDLKIYAILALPLIVATMVMYCFAEGLKSRSLRKEREKRKNSTLEEGRTSDSEEDD